MAKKVKAGLANVEVTNADTDGNAIQFAVKLAPWQSLVMLQSGPGLCVAKSGKNYIRFENSDSVQLFLQEVSAALGNTWRAAATSIAMQLKSYPRDTKVVIDLTQSFNGDSEEEAFLILFPGQYTTYRAFNMDMERIKDCKSAKEIRNFADCTYRVTATINKVNVTVVQDEKGQNIFSLSPFINVKILTLCLKNKQKPYDPEVASTIRVENNKLKELNELKAYFGGNYKKARLGLTDKKVVEVKELSLFSDEEADAEPSPPVAKRKAKRQRTVSQVEEPSSSSGASSSSAGASNSDSV